MDWHGVDRLVANVHKFARHALPHAVRNGLTRTAFEARGEYIESARSQLTLRNTFTERSIQVQPARGMRITRMEARTGSIAKYMEDQEEGATELASGKHGVPIPTSFAAGQGLRKRPRTKLVQRPNRLPAIHLASRSSGRTNNRMQRNAIAIRKAMKSGNRFVFLDTRTDKGRRKGLFRLQGSGQAMKVRLVWDLNSRAVRIPPRPLLARAVAQTMKVAPKIQGAALHEQLRRHKLFGY